MKKLFIVLLLFAICGFSYTPVPTVVYSGYVITSSGTTEVELQFSDLIVSSNKTLVYIQVDAANSGTVQFSVGKTIDASHQLYAASTKVPISITNGVHNLRYKASASSQKFSVSH